MTAFGGFGATIDKYLGVKMKREVGSENSADLVRDWNGLLSVFTSPGDRDSRDTLVGHMRKILFELHDFLLENVGITQKMSLKNMADDFTRTEINPYPEKGLAEVITDVFEDIAPHTVNVASPYFVGHMTAAIPFSWFTSKPLWRH